MEKESILKAPGPLLLSRREVDELYDLLEAFLEVLGILKIPYILIAGSLLGAVRSESILFNDDDVDIAIIDDRSVNSHDPNCDDNPYDRLKKYLPDLLRQSADRRNESQQSGVTWLHTKSVPVTYIYQIRPWIGGDRLRSSADPRVWIDVFVLKKYDTVDSLKEIISIKQNGERQSAEYVENILIALRSTQSSSQLKDIFPLYHYDNRKAIELWPKEFFLPTELLPLNQSFSFGPLKNLCGPHMPVRCLHRFFGEDCFTHYYKAEPHVRGKKQSKDDFLTWKQCEKLPLTDDMYMPIQHSKRQHSKRHNSSIAHTKDILMLYLENQKLVETSYLDDDTLLSLDELPLHVRRNQTDLDLGHPAKHCEMMRSRTFVANQELKEQSKWFGSAIRRHMNDSPDVPIFDQALRDLMEPHIAKARNRRKDCLLALYKTMPLPKLDVMKLSVSSKIGVPYPQLRVERPFLFDVDTYPLDRILGETLGISNLSLLHTSETQDKNTLLKPLLDRTGREPFHRCYDNFVTQFCIPLLHSIGVTERLFANTASLQGPQQLCYRYQAFPCIRIVRPGEFSIGPHCDITYGLSLGNINFHVPLTPVFGTNPLFIESHPGREDWHPLLTKSVGLGFIFDGARCIHFTLENTTDRTRLSIDFRISISRPTTVLYQRPSRIYSNWKFGELLESDDTPDIEDLDDELCCETMLQDRFASTPGYYEEAFVDLGFSERHTFLSSYSLVHKKNSTLMDPDYRVGFPFRE